MPVPRAAATAYRDYLAGAAWASLRSRALDRDGHRCRLCDSPDDPEVHHRRYPPPGRWDRDCLDAVTTLCGPCHRAATSSGSPRPYSTEAGVSAYKSLHFRITAACPLVMHNGRLADPLDAHARRISAIAAKRKKTDADHAMLGELEFLGGLYLSGGRPCLPAEMMEAALIRAAALERRGPKARAGLVVARDLELEYDGPREPRDLWADERFRLRAAVRVGTSRIMRTRPIFREWAADTLATNMEGYALSYGDAGHGRDADVLALALILEDPGGNGDAPLVGYLRREGGSYRFVGEYKDVRAFGVAPGTSVRFVPGGISFTAETHRDGEDRSSRTGRTPPVE